MDTATIVPPDTAATQEGATTSQLPADTTQSTPRIDYLIRFLMLIVAMALPALVSVHASGAADLDVFWHLRTGEWILQHHAIPHADPFSWTVAGKPWQAYSWLFELLAIQLFNHFGIVSMLWYTAVMLLVITVAIQHLIRRLQPRFSADILLMVGAAFGLGHLSSPRPWMFTILFFVLELDILMHARRTGKTRELVWLPIIFVLWSNLHIEFVDGLLVLALAAAEPVAARFLPKLRTNLSFRPLAAVLACSTFATLLNPFGWKVYSVVFDYTSRLAAHANALNCVTELQANPFRDIGNYCVLFLAMAAAATLARQGRFRFFETGLLAFAAVESFRSQRDVWLVVISSVAILAACVPEEKPALTPRPRRIPLLIATSCAGLLILLMRGGNIDRHTIEAETATIVPVRAVQAIQEHGYSGPLYDDYNWGGYLMWALHQPVSMDGRASLYGDEAIERSMRTWGGAPDWASDPALQAAGIVIGPVNTPLVQLLRTDPHFQLAYEDKLAAVFVAHH